MSDGSSALAERFRHDANACRRHGPTNARLLAAAADDLAAGGVTAEVMAGEWPDQSGLALGLRFAAAVHWLVLGGRAGPLARHYPSAGGRPDGDALWADAEPVIRANAAELRAVIRSSHVQTNEPGRLGPLFGGLLVAAELAAAGAGTGEPFPVRLLEVGASGGLNLYPDRAGYRLADGTVLGEPASPLVLDVAWTGLPPADPNRRLRVVHRAGCDVDPVDVSSTAGRLHLSSFVWPDQVHRLARLTAAMRLAELEPVRVDRAPGSSWLADQLAEPVPGVLTVVWHSIVWQYLPPQERDRGRQVVADAAAMATPAAPLALLVYESRRADRLAGTEGRTDNWSGPYRFELLLRQWPAAGSPVRLGHGSGHGIPFSWS